MKLTKGMFGSEFGQPTPEQTEAQKHFGVRTGQMRCGYESPRTHNGGWYNQAGEKLGWGDLDSNDFRTIQQKLEPGQMFLVLGEHDSFWNFVTRVGIIGSDSTTTPDVNAPGPEYVAEKAWHIITPEFIRHINDYDNPRDGEMSREEVKKLILG